MSALPRFVGVVLCMVGLSLSAARSDEAPAHVMPDAVAAPTPTPAPHIPRRTFADRGDKMDVALPGMIVDMIGRGFNRRQTAEAMGALFDRHTDRDIQPYGDLSAETLDAHLQSSLARRRAALVGQVMTADQDWDGNVTLAELIADRGARDADDEISRFDTDYDDSISAEELRLGAIRLIDEASSRHMLTQMLGWDFNGDGRVSRGEALDLLASRYLQPPPDPR